MIIKFGIVPECKKCQSRKFVRKMKLVGRFRKNAKKAYFCFKCISGV